MNSGSASKYQVLSTDQICTLPINNIAEKDCILFLWATTPLLPDAFKVMDAWGFKYKTAIYWRKIMSLGMGFWFRGQVELCLLGIKGKVKAFRCQHPNFIQCKVGKHSEKPKEFSELIQPFIIKPAIELFARKEREGWTCIGNNIDGQDIRGSLKHKLEQ